MQKVKAKGQSVRKIQWKQTDRQTDEGDCITSHANAIGKYLYLFIYFIYLFIRYSAQCNKQYSIENEYTERRQGI